MIFDKFKRLLARMASAVSEDEVVVISPRSLQVLGMLLALAIAYVALCLNQSSVGIWNNYFGPNAQQPTISLGSPKAVRSDEWNTLTPWILNQAARDFPRTNDNVGGERAAVLTGVPITDPLLVAQPKFWGFYLLPKAYGFSWSWAWKSFATIAALYLLFLSLTEGNIRWSILGSAWIYGSSFTQWWLSNGLPEMICATALAVLGALYLLRSQRMAGLLAGAVLVTFSVCNMMTYLYPAFQYPLLWLSVAIVLGKTIENASWSLALKHRRSRLIALGVCVIAISIFLYHFVRLTLPTIKLVMNTVYPGNRTSMGGDVPFYRLFDGFFEGFRMGQDAHPLSANASEASNFVLLFPFAMLLVPIRQLFKRDQALPLCLAFYCLFVCVWIAMPLPGNVRSVMAGLGWSLSPPVRSIVGVGLGSIILTVVIATRIHSGSLALRRGAWTIAPLTALALVAYGHQLHILDRAAFGHMVVLAGSLASFLVLASMSQRRVGMAAAGIAMFICLPLGVNPLVSGLDAILKKPILVEAKKVSKPSDRWMVVGSFVFSEGLKAQGLSVVTGSEYYPDQATINALDPKRQFKDVWNRYAHIVVASDAAYPIPQLTLNQADLYTVSMDVCGPTPEAWGVTMIAYTGPVPKADQHCLEAVPVPPNQSGGVSLFRLKDEKAKAISPT